MKVLMLSDHDCEGGAAIATRRIEASVRAALTTGDEMQRVVFFPSEASAAAAELWYEESAVKRKLLRLPRALLPGRFPRPHTAEFAADRLREVLHEQRPDVINVHNLHAASPWGWGPHLVEVCLQFAPVVWTLHDMWAFTGRCAYSYDCEKFIGGCDANCPTPHEAPSLAPAQIEHAWHERRQIYDRHTDNLIIITPSQWLAAQARRGMFARHRIVVIPYGVEPVQSPARAEARRRLNIDAAGPVLLLAAFDLGERRKGAEILPHLWRHVEQRPLTIVTMGRGAVAIDDPRIEVHPLGYLDDEQTKALAYAAADALLHPAPVDNFPNVVLEAMACGTPTIALPIGGLPEMVRPGVSGWLAALATPASLGHAVDKAGCDLARGCDLRESCRALLEREYAFALQGRRYRELFEDSCRVGILRGGKTPILPVGNRTRQDRSLGVTRISS